MIDPNNYPASRPEPVLDAQQLTRAVLGILGAVSALLALLGVTFNVDDDVTQTIGAVVGVAVLVAGTVLPRARALLARRHVTPLVDPRAADGTPLVKADGGPLA